MKMNSVIVLIRQCQKIIFDIGSLESKINVLIELEINIVRFICQMFLCKLCIIYFLVDDVIVENCCWVLQGLDKVKYVNGFLKLGENDGIFF